MAAWPRRAVVASDLPEAESRAPCAAASVADGEASRDRQATGNRQARVTPHPAMVIVRGLPEPMDRGLSGMPHPVLQTRTYHPPEASAFRGRRALPARFQHPVAKPRRVGAEYPAGARSAPTGRWAAARDNPAVAGRRELARRVSVGGWLDKIPYRESAIHRYRAPCRAGMAYQAARDNPAEKAQMGAA
jgi:hypothetical protein